MDTSVAVALSVADHEFHAATPRALHGRRLGFAGHAAFETFSVLTRLPAPARRPPVTIARLMRENFPASRFLSADATVALLARLAEGEIGAERCTTLLSAPRRRSMDCLWPPLDRRALDTYRVLAVDVEVVPPTVRAGNRA